MTFFRKFSEFMGAQILIGLVLSGLILLQQIRRGIISVATTRDSILALLEPYGIVIGAILLWHLGRTAYLLHLEDQAVIEELRTAPLITASEAQNVPLAEDPRIYVDFVDERKGYLHKKNALLLINRGGSEAHDVHIETIPLRGNSVEFPHVAADSEPWRTSFRRDGEHRSEGMANGIPT